MPDFKSIAKGGWHPSWENKGPSINRDNYKNPVSHMPLFQKHHILIVCFRKHGWAKAKILTKPLGTMSLHLCRASKTVCMVKGDWYSVTD